LARADVILKDCAINLDHLQTVSKTRIGELITTVGPDKMEQVQAAFLFALGFDF